jgi:hypothetical protein
LRNAMIDVACIQLDSVRPYGRSKMALLLKTGPRKHTWTVVKKCKCDLRYCPPL